MEGIITSGSYAFGTYFQRRFNLDSMQYNFILTLFITIANFIYAKLIHFDEIINYIYLINKSSNYNFIYLKSIPILFMLIITIIIKYIKKFVTTRNTVIYEIQDTDILRYTLFKFIKLNPEFFPNIQQINRVIQSREGDITRDPEILFKKPVHFHDTVNNIHGVIIFNMTTYTIYADTKDKLNMNKEKIIARIILHNYTLTKDYITVMQQMNADSVKNNSTEYLRFYKVFNNTVIERPYFQLLKCKRTEILTELISEYYSPYNNIIQSIIKTRSYHIHNYLLYGPPGTGKSKFINLVATSLSADIISVNLYDYINRKSDLYELFYSNKIIIQNKKNEKETIYVRLGLNQCIVLEEIDYSLVKICKYHEKRQLMATKQVTDDSKIIIHPQNDEDDKDLLYLGDLLELFQGLIDIPNRYILATTNNLESIQHLCPALFRPGRLTPLLIDHISWEILNQICMDYYGNTLNHEPIQINISTAEIIETIKYYKNNNKPFAEFQHKIITELLKKL